VKTLPIRVLIIALIGSFTGMAQQFSLSVPIRAVARDTQNFPVTWLATERGLYRSPDTGNLWRSIYVRPAGRVQPAVRQIYIDPANSQTIYLVSDMDSGGIWKSVNGGTSWAQANAGLPKTGAIDAFIALPAAPLTIYAKVGNQVFKTIDGAEVWTLRGTLPLASSTLEVNRTIPALMFTSANNGLYRSRDEGATWTFTQTLNLSRDVGIAAILQDQSDAKVIHLVARGPSSNGTSGAGFYRSIDSGDRFEAVILPKDREFVLPAQLVTDPAGSAVYSGSDENGIIYFTKDKGITWGSFILPGVGFSRISIDPRNPRALLAGAARGFFTSNNAGERWDGSGGTARPTLGLPEQPLDFVIPAGVQGRLQLPLRVVETNQWTLPLSAAASGGAWLTLTGVAVNTPAIPDVSADARELEPGDYAGNIRVDAPLAGNDPVNIPVSLKVVSPRPVSEAYRISTMAGNGTRGNFGDNQLATRASFGELESAAFDRDGNLYVSDPASNVIRRISAADGTITRFAGNATRGDSGDAGPALLARMSSPSGLAFDGPGNLYVVDSGNFKIRRIAPDGTITTFAAVGRAGKGLTMDPSGNLYMAIPSEHVVVRVTPSGQITLYSGEPGVAGFSGDGGPPGQARLSGPSDVFSDARGQIYIADTGNHRIRRVASGAIGTVAGSGGYGYQGEGIDATKVALASPSAVAADAAGNIFISDAENHRIRIVYPSGATRTIAGTGIGGFSGDNGPATRARIATPQDLVLEPNGSLLSVESTNLRIRRLTPPAAPIVPVINEGPLNWADGSTRLSPGTIFRLLGSDLSEVTASRPDAPWPADFGGVRVTLNGAAVPLSQVSPGEVIGLIPYNAPPGSASMQLFRDDVPSAEVVITLDGVAPTLILNTPGRALAANESGSANSTAQPAPPESLLTLYFTGMGLTENPPVGGAGAGEEAKLLLPMQVQFGAIAIDPVLARLAPGRVGVAEVQFRIPVNAEGDYQVLVRVGDVLSAAAAVSVGIK
jgi:uncharacterized protein (TIGR03437 family)